jgi:hypothetical protein
MRMAKGKAKAGRVSMSDLMAMVNKKAGRPVAHDLRQDNPTEVKEWIPTGSRWLDSIICKGKYAGIPVLRMLRIWVSVSYTLIQSQRLIQSFLLKQVATWGQ